jgi:hypothetical protein
VNASFLTNAASSSVGVSAALYHCA